MLKLQALTLYKRLNLRAAPSFVLGKMIRYAVVRYVPTSVVSPIVGGVGSDVAADQKCQQHASQQAFHSISLRVCLLAVR